MAKVEIRECKKIHKKIIEKHNQLREIYKFNFHRRSASGIDPIQKTSDKIISEIHMIREEIIDEWEIYLEKIPVTKILKELDKLPEYNLPTEQSSTFILPNGKIVGSDIIFNHLKMLEKIIGKLDRDEYFKHLLMLRVVKLVVDDSVLYININTHVTDEQKAVLEKLRKCDEYNEYAVDTYGGEVRTKKSILDYDYIYKILDLKKP